MQLIPCQRVRQPQLAGMQCRPRYQFPVLPAIKPVSRQRITYGGHVQPKLMCAAGMRYEPQQRKTIVALQRSVLSKRRRSQRLDSTLVSGALLKAYGQLYPAALRLNMPYGYSHVFPPEPVRVHYKLEPVVHITVLGYRHYSCRAPVQPAYRVKILALLQSRGKSIFQRKLPGIPGRAVYRNTGGLINYYHSIYINAIFKLVFFEGSGFGSMAETSL